VHVVSAFPFYYLFYLPADGCTAYTLSAAFTGWLSRYRRLTCGAGSLGFVAAGILTDIWITSYFAYGVAAPPSGNWSVIIPLLGFAYGLVLSASHTGRRVFFFEGWRTRK